jgi:hypothetical protein
MHAKPTGWMAGCTVVCGMVSYWRIASASCVASPTIDPRIASRHSVSVPLVSISPMQCKTPTPTPTPIPLWSLRTSCFGGSPIVSVSPDTRKCANRRGTGVWGRRTQYKHPAVSTHPTLVYLVECQCASPTQMFQDQAPSHDVSDPRDYYYITPACRGAQHFSFSAPPPLASQVATHCEYIFYTCGHLGTIHVILAIRHDDTWLS